MEETKITIAVSNQTKENLQVKNNMLADFGPQKGQWMVHKEYIIRPGDCVQTDFFREKRHQLMVYSVPQPENFLYMIRDTDVEDGDTAKLFDKEFKIIHELLCSDKK